MDDRLYTEDEVMEALAEKAKTFEIVPDWLREFPDSKTDVENVIVRISTLAQEKLDSLLMSGGESRTSIKLGFGMQGPFIVAKAEYKGQVLFNFELLASECEGLHDFLNRLEAHVLGDDDVGE